MDPGHVFVVHGNLGRLACDDVLIPTDSQLRVTRGFHALVGSDLLADDTGYERRIRSDRVQAHPNGVGLLDSRDGEARRWLVDTETGDVDQLVRRVEHFVGACLALEPAPLPRHGRAKRLLALPLVGTGEGGAAGRRGDVIAAMLPLLQGITESADVDVALVLRDSRDAAAAQEVRRRAPNAWPLAPELLTAADELAARALQGSLALFVGAGVSRAAGMPMWEELLDLLADAAGLSEAEAAQLDELAPPDAAQLLCRRLGADRFAAEVTGLFDRDQHALAHALLAELPVSTAVTTNWDPLLEHAYAGAGRKVRVLPRDRAVSAPEASADHRPTYASARPELELVKLHGDIGHPEDIVLTRESYLRLPEEQAALTGVVQALLLTRHVLFVGFSLLDDTFIRIAHQTRRVLQGRHGPEGDSHVGSVLALRDDPVRRELWATDLDFISVSPPELPREEAARRLEVFLDRLAASTSDRHGWLLDPRYAALRTPADDALVTGLGALIERSDDMRASPGWALLDVLRAELGGGAEGARSS